MRALGLDVGTKTIGLALSDELRITAQPAMTIRRTSMKADLRELQQFVTDNSVTTLVVGLPLNMNGSEGPRALESRKLGDAIGSMTQLTVIYWDERWSTVAAERSLIEGEASRKKRKEVIDQIAAAIILQGWLDAQPRDTDADAD